MNEENIYQVIGFPDEYTLIINAGSNNSNLSIDDEVRIFEQGEEVIDIDGSILGRYEFIKDILTVVAVTENYSICQKIKKINQPSIISSLAGTSQPRTTTRREKLSVSENDILNWERNNEYISIGDLAVKN